MEAMTETDLRELVDDSLQEYRKEGLSKAACVESTIHDLGHLFIRQPKNALLAHRLLLSFLEGEEHTLYYKTISSSISHLEKSI